MGPVYLTWAGGLWRLLLDLELLMLYGHRYMTLHTQVDMEAQSNGGGSVQQRQKAERKTKCYGRF